MSMLTVIGIDPGTRKMGYGVVVGEGEALSFAECGVLEAPSSLEIQDRLSKIYSQLLTVLERCKPSEMAVESPFVAKNVQSAMAVGEARAVAMLAAAQRGIRVYQYTPSTVKQSVTDYGASTKEQVQEMVRMLLNLEQSNYPLDASDAMAVAVCHLLQSRLKRLVETQGSR